MILSIEREFKMSKIKILKQKVGFFEKSNKRFQGRSEQIVTVLPSIGEVNQSKQTLLGYLSNAYLKTIESELKNLELTKKQIMFILDSKEHVKDNELLDYLDMAYEKHILQLLSHYKKSNYHQKENSLVHKLKGFFFRSKKNNEIEITAKEKFCSCL